MLLAHGDDPSHGMVDNEVGVAEGVADARVRARSATGLVRPSPEHLHTLVLVVDERHQTLDDVPGSPAVLVDPGARRTPVRQHASSHAPSTVRRTSWMRPPSSGLDSLHQTSMPSARISPGAAAPATNIRAVIFDGQTRVLASVVIRPAWHASADARPGRR